MGKVRVEGPRPFAFDLDAKRISVTDRKMLEGLKLYAGEHGAGPFTMAQFDAWIERPCNAGTISRRFGGWRLALTAAGIEGVSGGRYKPGELMAILEEVWREIDRPPGLRTLRLVGRVSGTPFRRRWGSIQNACRRLARYHKGEISREEMLAADPHGVERVHAVRPHVRWKVLDRDGQCCVVCGRPGGEAGVILEVDHIIPFSQGGSDDMENLRTLCRACNRGKGASKS